MIARIWHGWTTPDSADVYEALLKTEIFPGIAAREVAGYRGIQLGRRPLDDEVEFVTIMWFDSWEAVKAFAARAELLGDPDGRALAERHLAMMFERYLSAETGSWCNRLGRDGTVLDPTAPTRILYHVMMCVSEAMRVFPEMA